jgi:hypothetical protein
MYDVNGQEAGSINLLSGMSNWVGATVAADQYMAFAILHEVAHTRGGSHPGTTEPNYDKAIWDACF